MAGDCCQSRRLSGLKQQLHVVPAVSWPHYQMKAGSILFQVRYEVLGVSSASILSQGTAAKRWGVGSGQEGGHSRGRPQLPGKATYAENLAARCFSPSFFVALLHF